jgi:hypothetical protein
MPDGREGKGQGTVADFGRRLEESARPNYSKQIQAKLLGFAWFYSSGLGLFNGLQRFQIKILSLLIPARAACDAGSPF